MIAELLHRITTKIRRLWHAKERARLMAGFLASGKIVILMVKGITRVRTCNRMTGRSTGYCGQVAAPRYYPLFDIHRQAPVLT